MVNMGMPVRSWKVLLTAGLALTVTGCGGSDVAAPPAVSLAPSEAEAAAGSTSPTACPAAEAGPGQAWPDGVPASFPVFDGQTVNAPTTMSGATVVQFGLPLELAAATDLVRAQLPAAGYELGESDSEEGRESDTRFSGADGSGRLKVVRLDDCGSRAILAISPPGATPAQTGDADQDEDEDAEQDEGTPGS